RRVVARPSPRTPRDARRRSRTRSVHLWCCRGAELQGQRHGGASPTGVRYRAAPRQGKGQMNDPYWTAELLTTLEHDIRDLLSGGLPSDAELAEFASSYAFDTVALIR